MTTNKPFAPACERNQDVILDVLQSILEPTDKHLLEIGSGTGQHAVYMAPHFPQLQWHTADVAENHHGIQMWLDEAKLSNVIAPIHFEVGQSEFPKFDVDVVFTANTLHIMSWQNVQELIQQLGVNLKYGAKVLIYGPFNYQGKFTSQSNADFDVWLKQQAEYSGIRDFESVIQLMDTQGIALIKDVAMPANNRILYFKKGQ